MCFQYFRKLKIEKKLENNKDNIPLNFGGIFKALDIEFRRKEKLINNLWRFMKCFMRKKGRMKIKILEKNTKIKIRKLTSHYRIWLHHNVQNVIQYYIFQWSTFPLPNMTLIWLVWKVLENNFDFKGSPMELRILL